ncbi:hypothetical protein IWW50_001175 [Coemansia erecta]|nr:hypothetical protein GGF43_003302 [Coemansia sp. RSA 2618]KAJ2828836.1 hypothetical protein IWW50_001175 [Coemansia erecta]
MCPGANGQHDYFLRCLSGTFVHFACPPGTACIKNEGQNMFCGWPSKGAAGPAPNTDNTSPTIDSGESTGKSSSVIDIGGSASESSPVIDVGGSTSESSPVIDIGGSTSETSPVIDIGGSTSETSPDIDIGGSTSDGLPDITTGGETSEGLPDIDIGSSAEEDTSSTHGLFDDLPPLFPSTSSDIDTGVDASGEISLSSADSTKLEEPTTESAADTAEASQSESLSAEAPPSIQDTSEVQPTATKHNNGLSGPVISSGLEMLLQNGVQLPFTLPNIDLPEINLATVHLPDMTFDGIAITGIPLPSVTIPPMNPASLTNFNYIEEIMSKAGITFDDLANLPLPDLNNLNLSDLGHIDVASVMSIMNVNRISVQDGVSAQNLAETLPPATDAPHTTTLDADGIDALLGLSVMTYSSV